jgi:hypothetical protein
MAKIDLTDNQVAYLRGLVRVSIRKQRQSVAGFAPKPGQDPAEAAAVLAKFRAQLAFREAAYEALGGNPETMSETGGNPL